MNKNVRKNRIGTRRYLTKMLVGQNTTYLCPSLPVEHRPSTTSRHCTLFWAALVIPDQLVPCCFRSVSVSHLQLLRGRPLFLFPCGFQVRAWRVVLDAGFLRVCPIQPHFPRSICLATGSCPALSPLATWTVFPVSYIVLMFHVASRVNVLGVRRGVSLAASFWLSLHCVISFLDGDPSLPRWVLWFLDVEAFVTRLFLWVGLLALHQPLYPRGELFLP